MAMVLVQPEYFQDYRKLYWTGLVETQAGTPGALYPSLTLPVMNTMHAVPSA